MKPRLFWTMLLAFGLVIVLGICGMLGFFGLAIAGIWQPQSVRDSFQESQHSYAASLADYYTAHGNSWDGVEERLAPPFPGPSGFIDYALVDQSGQVVASNDRSLPVGRAIEKAPLAYGVPVEAHGKRVGTLIVRSGPNVGPGSPFEGRRPPDIFWSIVRSFLIAGLILASMLLLLAIAFAQRLSRPLHDMTKAAQAMAGGQLDVQVRAAPVRELNDLSNAFNAMARSLARADQQRRQMTADIAHELRTPLTIIKGRLEGLQDGVYSATPDQLERLLDETALLERLIEDLRLLALAEAGQLPLYVETLDPRALLEGAAAAFAGQAETHGVTIRVEAPDDLPQIEADPQRLAQVLANLTANALRYTPPGGTIALRASFELRVLSSELFQLDAETQNSKLKTHNSVVFRVSDTGEGIAAEDLPQIFDRFYRADRSRARGTGGAGLGLAIARQIVAAHGGEIWAESEPGQGTTISIALPTAKVVNGE
jgi:signal transduction histidine kinase